MFGNKNKKERKYFGVLRKLAKSDCSVINKLKITVSKSEFIEENEHNFIGPSKLMSYPENLINQNLNQTSVENTIKSSNELPKIAGKNEIHSLDYPDSSDFSDDE